MNQADEIVAIVPAAGAGKRMNASCPKQYLKINDKTILEHTVYKLLSHAAISKVIVVVSKDDEYFANTSLSNHPKVTATIGGDERSDSVLEGLNVANSEWVMVHDAARPCVRHQDIDELIKVAMAEEDGAILAMKARDTIKKANGNHIETTLDRNSLWQALTPQMFKREQIINALILAKQKSIQVTDEASALELLNKSPALVEGHSDNIKVTLPEDLALASYFLNLHKEKR